MWRPFVPFCSQFSFQLCSRVTPLRPSLPEVGLVRIKETGSWSFPARVGDGSGSDPALNCALAHPQRSSNRTALHTLGVQVQDVFIPRRSFGLTGLVRLLDGLRLGRTPFLGTAHPRDAQRDGAPHQRRKVSVSEDIRAVGRPCAHPTDPCHVAEIPKGKGECSMLGSKAT